MLVHKIDMDRAFDLTIKQTHPYLIFSHDDFKLTLSSMLSSLFQYYSESNEIKFEELNGKIEKMLSEVQLDSHNDNRVYDFKHRQMTLDQAHREINKRMIETDKFLAEFESIKTRLKRLENEPKTRRKNRDDKSQDRDDKSQDTRTSHVQKVIECLKNSGSQLKIEEIANLTDTTIGSVKFALTGIQSRKSGHHKNTMEHIKIEKIVYKPRPKSGSYGYATYQWIDNLEPDQN
jgi:hypothetical protein